MNYLSPLESVGETTEFSIIVSAILICVMGAGLWVFLAIVNNFKAAQKRKKTIIFGWCSLAALLIAAIWQQSFQTMHENKHLRKMDNAIKMRIQHHHKHHKYVE